MVLLGLTTVTLSWPHALLRDVITEYTAFGEETYLYISVFVFGGLLLIGIWNFFSPISSRNFTDIRRPFGEGCLRASQFVHTQLFIVLLIVFFVYLAYVPPFQTGLYAILFDPENSGLARENSLKLLEFPLLQYAYLITYSVIAPLAFLFAVNLFLTGRKVTAVRLIVETAIVCIFLLLTGARAGLAYLALCLLLLLMVRRNLKFRWIAMMLAFGAFLYLPAILSMLREGDTSDGSSLVYIGLILDRIFLLPTIISAWFLEYANSHGFGGWSAVVDGIGSLYNSVALEYGDRYDTIRDSNITAPTAYFVQNLYIFYWAGLIPSWLGLILMDLPLIYIKNLLPSMRGPFYAMGMFYALYFLQAGYGVVWLTHVYLIFLLLTVAIYHLVKCKPFSDAIRLDRIKLNLKDDTQ